MRYAMAYHSILKGHRTVFVTGMTDIGQRRVGDDRPVCSKQFGDMEFGWVPSRDINEARKSPHGGRSTLDTRRPCENMR